MIISIWRTAKAALLVLAVWFAGLAILTLLAEPTPTVLVFGPRAAVLNAAAQADMAVIEIRPAMSRMRRSARPGFVRALYAHGAWLVMPSPEGGCLGIPLYQ